MKGLGTDFRLGARRLLATPLFSVFAVLSIAVGVGVTTAVYSVVDAIFLRELGFPDPASILFVVAPGDGRVLRGSISEPDFRDIGAAQTSFRSVRRRPRSIGGHLDDHHERSPPKRSTAVLLDARVTALVAGRSSPPTTMGAPRSSS